MKASEEEQRYVVHFLIAGDVGGCEIGRSTENLYGEHRTFLKSVKEKSKRYEEETHAT